MCACFDEVKFSAGSPGYRIYVELTGSGSKPDFNFLFKIKNERYQFYHNYVGKSSSFTLNGKTYENVEFLQLNPDGNDTARAVVYKYYGIIYIEINDDHWEIPAQNPANGNYSAARFEDSPC
jgi:hypothetical protein